MTASGVDGIIESLRQEEARLDGIVAGIRDELKTQESELDRVRKALAALGEKTPPKSKGKKSAATKAEVSAAIATVLTEHGPLELEDLKKQTSERVSASGKTLQGFALRFKEALADSSRFVDSPGGYRLTDDTAEQPATVAHSGTATG